MLPEFRDGWGGCDYKEVLQGDFCGDGIVLYLDCGDGSQIYTCNKIASHTHCTYVNFLVFIWYYNYVRCNHWGRLGNFL